MTALVMPVPTTSPRSARATAWVFFGFGVLVVVAGVAQFVLVGMGPRPSGCSGMVKGVMAILALGAAVVVGVPHVLVPLWFLKRPRSGRTVFLGLVVVNALIDAATVVAFAVEPSSADASIRMSGIALWSALFLVNLAALWILLRRARA